MTGATPPRRPARAAPAKRRAAAQDADGAADKARLLHKLEVHRIELEVQNEALRESQAALTESRDSYVDLYDFAPVGYLALDDRGRIVKTNLAGATLLGVSRSRLIARRFVRFVAGVDGGRWQELFLDALGQRDKTGGELLLVRKDGSSFQAQVDCRKAAGGVLLTLVDISNQKRVEAQLIASEKRYFALFRDGSDAIAIADANGCLEEVNRRFASLLGYDEEELRGASIERLHPPDELPRIRRHFGDIVRNGSVESLETRIVRKDGVVVEVEIRPTPIDIGGRVAAQGVFIDLTERRRQEQLRIEQERQQRNALVREVHHRIKNNLQSVNGLLQRELGKFIEIDRRLQTAISQVNAIAVVHGLQCDHPDEAIRLCDSVRHICETVGGLFLRPLCFEIENEQTTFRPAQIAADEAVSVALVLNELILNAVKHSPADGAAPRVMLSADGNSARVLIRNAVTTLPELDLDAGTGLGTGLRLVRSLLPAQGAHLAYEADPEGAQLLTRLTLAAPVIARRTPRDPG